MRPTAKNIDDYIREFPQDTAAVLERVRSIIREEAPGATETISYAIPTFDLAGKHLLHFAGYGGHVGLYPTPSGMAAFDEELRTFQHGKGSVRFPLGEQLPEDLIRRIVRFRVQQALGTKQANQP